MNLNKQNLINKIIYRSNYRGTKEMDIFLSSFVKSSIDALNIKELEDLNYIINLSDEEISKIIKNDINENNYNNKIVKLLINFKKKY